MKMSKEVRENMEYRRGQNALLRNEDNLEILIDAGIDEEVAEKIISVCRLRHSIHSDLENIWRCGWNTDVEDIEGILEELSGKDGLPTFTNRELDTNPYSLVDFWILDDGSIHVGGATPTWSDVDSELESPDYEDYWLPELGDTTRDRLYAAAYSKFRETMEIFNTDIEKWLGEIDKKYNTDLRSTGTHRSMGL